MTEAAKLKVQASDKGGDALAARCEIWACGGHFLVEGTSNGLVGLTLVDGSPRPLSTGTYQVSFRSRANRSQRTRADELLEQAVHELANYLAGRQKIFTVPLCLEHVASPFYRRVLAACSDILYGTAVSYSDLARAANLAPTAARAVGRALAANPLPIFIPCHRVVRADGGLGGFAWGEQWKRFLLQLEGVSIPSHD